MKKISLITGLIVFTLFSCNQKAKQKDNLIEEEQQIENKTELLQDKIHFSKEVLMQEFIGLDNKSINMQQILDINRGNVVVIDIWASWCKDCIKAFETTRQIQQDFPEVTFVYISADKTEQSWKEGIGKFNLNGQHYYIPNGEGMKGSFGKSIDLKWIPRYIVIDKDTKVALYDATEKNFDDIRVLLQKLQ